MRRISTKLTFAALAVIALVMGIHAVQRVERESDVFTEDVRRDDRVLGHALAETAASLVDHVGPAEALLAINDADQRRNHVLIEWHTAGQSALMSSIEKQDGEEWVITRVPVITTTGPMGYLELRESLRPRDQYLRDTVNRVATVTLLMLVACTLLIHFAGKWILERPLGVILEKIRRIGAGDLGGPIAARRNDELGVVAREVDVMCARLADLQQTAAREADARIAALEQLRHADRLSTVGKLAAGVAHELGTPLNVVGARAKMIQRGESEGDEVLDDARVIVEQTDRMTRIIRQLLDFARRRPPSREPTDLRAAVSNAIAMLSPLAQRSRVTLRLLEGASVEASVDGGQIQQVLTNLIVNAIQAQPDGGEVEVDVSGGDGPAQIVVRDRGPGLARELRTQIFEPFYTTKDVGDGTGLGLSVVHGIVEEHGGRIMVDDNPGGGTRFVVELPRDVA